MDISNAQTSVENWMIQFGQEVPESPKIPCDDILKLRAKLILEEALETIIYGLGLDSTINPTREEGGHAYLEDILNALKRNDFFFFRDADREPNLTAIQDGCSDLHVVTLGTEAACGLKAEPAFQEVMRSNFSKMWTTAEVESPAFNQAEYSRECDPLTWRDLHTRCWLVKNSAGKVIKSPSYSPANLQPIINRLNGGFGSTGR